MKRNRFLFSSLLFILPLALATAVVSLLELSLPNSIQSPLWQKISILPSLFASNFFQSMYLVLFDFYVLAIQSVIGTNVSWGIYWRLSDIILLVFSAIVVSQVVPQWRALSCPYKVLTVFAVVLCWSALFDLWLSGCCTAGPDWWLEVVFLAKAYVSNPYLDKINWQGMYQSIAAVSVLLRILLYVAGMLLIQRVLANFRKVKVSIV